MDEEDVGKRNVDQGDSKTMTGLSNRDKESQKRKSSSRDKGVTNVSSEGAATTSTPISREAKECKNDTSSELGENREGYRSKGTKDSGCEERKPVSMEIENDAGVKGVKMEIAGGDDSNKMDKDGQRKSEGDVATKGEAKLVTRRPKN